MTSDSSAVTLVPDRKVMQRYSVSRMTLYRWERDPRLNFPKAIQIRGRNYRVASDLDAFDAALQKKGGAEPRPNATTGITTDSTTIPAVTPTGTITTKKAGACEGDSAES